SHCVPFLLLVTLRSRSSMPVQPSGTITFLFTDIEGSTSRWERERDAMSCALRRHEQIIHGAIAEYGGWVFKTVGDAFCVAFSTAREGLAAAISAQCTLLAEEWELASGPIRVRMALHAGTAEERNQ